MLGPGIRVEHQPQVNRVVVYFLRRFFETISSLLPDKYKQNVLVLHKQLSAVMRIISSQPKVDVDLFEQLCVDIITFHGFV